MQASAMMAAVTRLPPETVEMTDTRSRRPSAARRLRRTSPAEATDTDGPSAVFLSLTYSSSMTSVTRTHPSAAGLRADIDLGARYGRRGQRILRAAGAP